MLAVLIAAGIPAVFLLIIYTLDLYASRTFRLVLLCFGWGAIGAFGLAYVINTYVGFPLAQSLSRDPFMLLTLIFAPVVEEIVKSLSLFYVSRRSEFTYFVDGAIYGFAAGIGFSIVENFLYIGYHPELAVPLAFVRAFSVCLMHGAASGLVGVAVGRSRFRRLSGRGLALLDGWGGAILIHAFFNSISQTGVFSERLVVPLSVGVGLAGVGLIVLFVVAGLGEERRWVAEMLDRNTGMTDAELKATREYGTLSFDEVLEPVFEQFPRRAEQIEFFLRHQAQIGIKRKVRQQVDDPALQKELGRKIVELETETDQLRKGMGMCARTYIQCVFPEHATEIWPCVEELVTCELPIGDEA